MTLISRMPIFPLYYNGETKFMPIHCSDLTDVILETIKKDIKATTIECGGPQIISFKEIIITLMSLIEKKRLLLPLPLFVGKIIAKTLENFPKPLLTSDQLRLLKYDNVYSNKFKTNSEYGVPIKKIFNEEVKKYSYMWKDGGIFNSKTTEI